MIGDVFFQEAKKQFENLFFPTILPIYMVFVSTYVRTCVSTNICIYIYMNHSARIISDYALVLVITHFSY